MSRLQIVGSVFLLFAFDWSTSTRKSVFFISGVSTLVKIDKTALQQLQANNVVFDILIEPKA